MSSAPMPRCMQTRRRLIRARAYLLGVAKILFSSKGAAYKQVAEVMKARGIEGQNICDLVSKEIELVPADIQESMGEWLFERGNELKKAQFASDYEDLPGNILQTALDASGYESGPQPGWAEAIGKLLKEETKEI